MALVPRKPRPLNRDSGFRDDRLCIIACDDCYAPKQYFEFFAIPRIQIHVVSTQDGTSVAEHVLDRLLDFKKSVDSDDELWMLLDTDHCIRDTHLGGFTEALRRASKAGVNVALSRPSFELWLLLHYRDESAVLDLPNATKVEEALRDILGGYNKTKLKREHYPGTLLATAIERAERLDLSVPGGDIPSSNTTRVYRLWKSIVSKALPSQLPVYLRAIQAVQNALDLSPNQE